MNGASKTKFSRTVWAAWRGFCKPKLLTTSACAILCLSCGRKSDATATQAAPQGTPSPEVLAQQSVLVSRLTPEQLSRILKLQLNFESGWTDSEDGTFHDQIVETLGVPLGGIDLKRTFIRDFSPKVHTILVSRALAWAISGAVVWWEFAPDKANKLDRKRIFTFADIARDIPFQSMPEAFRKTEKAKASDTAWHAQLEDLYYRIYSRPPKENEIDLCSNAFTIAAQQSGFVPRGWQVILYALLSSSEFLNVWGVK